MGTLDIFNDISVNGFLSSNYSLNFSFKILISILIETLSITFSYYSSFKFIKINYYYSDSLV